MNKAQKWISKGAPVEAIDFLNKAVDGLHQIAVEKNIVFKGDEVMTNDNVTEVTANDVQATEETVETTSTNTEVTDTEPTNTEPNIADVIQKGVAEAIVVALKEYNASVVAPLQAQVAELLSELKTSNKTVRKGFDGAQNVFFGASDFMPAAAVSAMLKKEFGSDNDTKSEDIVVKDVEEVKTAVTEKKVTKSVGDTSNVLAGF